MGRFTTPDPALDVRGDGDIYDYCVDDPVNLVDAKGLEFTSAEAVAAAKKGHRGIKHPFGAKHGTTPIRSGKSRSEKKEAPSARDRSRERGKMLERALRPNLEAWGNGIVNLDKKMSPFSWFFDWLDYYNRKK